MQCNYGSIMGQYGKKAQIIVKKKFTKIIWYIFRNRCAQAKHNLWKNPRNITTNIWNNRRRKTKRNNNYECTKVLENKRIDIDEPKQIKLSLKEKIILK